MKKNGFTFVEIIFAVTIFLIIVLGVYGGYRGLYSALASAHLKVVVASVVNERFEIMRNLPYTDVGTVGGVPSGKIPPIQTVVKDGITWDVTTVIQNVDDPFDGQGGADPKPADYKLIEVSVACATCKNYQTVVISGLVAPRSLEP